MTTGLTREDRAGLVGKTGVVLYSTDGSSVSHHYYVPIVCVVFGALRFFKGISAK